MIPTVQGLPSSPVANTAASRAFLSVVSPYMTSDPQDTHVASEPAVPPVENRAAEESHQHSSISVTQAVIGGVLAASALAGGLAATGHLTYDAPRTSISFSTNLVSDPDYSAHGSYAASTHLPIAPSQMQGHQVTLADHIFGEDIGGTGTRVPSNWETYKGTFNGKDYEFKHPAGWKVVKLTGFQQGTVSGIATYDPSDPNTIAVFQMGGGGMGMMNNQGLINKTLMAINAQNYRVLNQSMQGPSMTKMGPLYVLNQDANYTYEGVQVRGHFMSTLINTSGIGIQSWYGGVFSYQTPVAKQATTLPVLSQISNSFTNPQ